MKRLPALLAALAAFSALAASVALASPPRTTPMHDQLRAKVANPRTPIRHVVEIFQENVSFDHYFGTYPYAANSDGENFSPLPHTPAVDGLSPATSSSIPPSLRHSSNLLTSNPNQSLPRRLDSNAVGLAGDAGGQLTCDQDHNYSDEQQSFDGGLMDRFVQSVGTGGGTTPFGAPCNKETVMDYYDGNTVTGLWNYAQHYAMSDNSYGTTFGPSAPGAINLVSGNTGNVDVAHEANAPTIATSTSPDADLTADGKGGFSLTSDAQPYWDDCSTRDAVALTGKNIGDELNAAGLSWGWFEGGFRPSTSYQAALEATGQAGQPTSTFVPDQFKAAEFQKSVPHSSNQGLCDAVTPVGEALGGSGQWGYKDDYIPHHEPFQYYASTANPHHLTIARNPAGHDKLAGSGDDRHRHPVLRQRRAAVQHPQPQLRHERFRPAGDGNLQPRAAVVGPAGGQLPQGSRLPGRPCRLLRPGRRAGIRRPHGQRDHEHAGLAPHGDRHQLRRFRRLV